MSFRTLLRHEPRAVSFGLLHTIAATIGQTFVISLFLPGIKETFALGDAQLSVMFTATTLASAAALWKIGAWIDRSDLLHYSLWCGVFLGISCAMIAAAPFVIVLILGLFCLRLAGNGLLTHVAVTATARYFSKDRGQALSLVLLGTALGEAAFPAPLVTAINAFGWRSTLVAAGCLGVLLVIAAAIAVQTHAVFRSPQTHSEEVRPGPLQENRPARESDYRRYFALTSLLFIAMPLVITAAIFHQALIAQEKRLSLEWFAISFVAFAIIRVPVSVVTGKIVDRIGSPWLFSIHLLPLAAGTAALIMITSPWVAPLFWFFAGVTVGMGGVLQNTIVAERVSLPRLGAARSILAAVAIVASAAGPSLFGGGLASGATMSAILWASVAMVVGATALALVATKLEQQQRTMRPQPRAK